jgi:hypothetical protein
MHRQRHDTHRSASAHCDQIDYDPLSAYVEIRRWLFTEAGSGEAGRKQGSRKQEAGMQGSMGMGAWEHGVTAPVQLSGAGTDFTRTGKNDRVGRLEPGVPLKYFRGLRAPGDSRVMTINTSTDEGQFYDIVPFYNDDRS